MRIRLTFPLGSQIDSITVDMPAIPREGEIVYSPAGDTYIARTVAWYPWDSNFAGEPVTNLTAHITLERSREEAVTSHWCAHCDKNVNGPVCPVCGRETD